MYCPACGEQVPDHSRFCLHCGEPIEADGTIQTSRDIESASPAQVTSDAEPKITLGTSDITEAGGKRQRVAWFLGWLLISLALLIALFGLRRPARQSATDASPPTHAVSEGGLTPTVYSYSSLVTAKAQRATETPRPRSTRTPRPSATSWPTATPGRAVSAVVTSKGLNVRAGPGIGYQRLGAVGQGTELVLDGRDETGIWVHGQASGDDLTGWLSTGYLRINGDMMQLPVVKSGVLVRPRATPVPTVVPRPTQAPAPIGGWYQVAHWAGNSIKNTEVFHISSRDWRIVWSVGPGEFEPNNFCHFYLQG